MIKMLEGFVSWSDIWQMLNPDLFDNNVKNQMKKIPVEKKSFWQKLKRN